MKIIIYTTIEGTVAPVVELTEAQKEILRKFVIAMWKNHGG
ncbi:hypothetical protein [Candidatus Chlorohelix allophototropha]